MASPNGWVKPQPLFLWPQGAWLFFCLFFCLFLFFLLSSTNLLLWTAQASKNIYVINAEATMRARFSQQPGTIPSDTSGIPSDIWAARETLSHGSRPVTIHNDLWPLELLSRHYAPSCLRWTLKNFQDKPRGPFTWVADRCGFCFLLLISQHGGCGGALSALDNRDFKFGQLKSVTFR